MGATPFFGKKVKGTSRIERDVHVIRVESTSTYASSLSGSTAQEQHERRGRASHNVEQ
jgi:hypothetical protein